MEEAQAQSTWRLATSSRSPPVETEISLEVVNSDQQPTNPTLSKTALPVRNSSSVQTSLITGSTSKPNSTSSSPAKTVQENARSIPSPPISLSHNSQSIPEYRKASSSTISKRKQSAQPASKWQQAVKSMKDDLIKEDKLASENLPKEKLVEIIDLTFSSDEEERPRPLKNKQHLRKEEVLPAADVLDSAERSREAFPHEGMTSGSVEDFLASREGSKVDAPEKQLPSRDEDNKSFAPTPKDSPLPKLAEISKAKKGSTSTSTLSPSARAGQLPPQVETLQAEGAKPVPRQIPSHAEALKADVSKPRPTLLPSLVFRESNTAKNIAASMRSLESPAPEAWPDEHSPQIPEEQAQIAEDKPANLSSRSSWARSTESINKDINQWLKSSEVPISKHIPGTTYEVEGTPSPDMSKTSVTMLNAPFKTSSSDLKLFAEDTIQKSPVLVETQSADPRKLKCPNSGWKKNLIISRNDAPQPTVKRSLKTKPKTKPPLVQARTSKGIAMGTIAEPISHQKETEATEMKITDIVEDKTSYEWKKVEVKADGNPLFAVKAPLGAVEIAMVQKFWILAESLCKCLPLAEYLMETGIQDNIIKNIDTEVFSLLIKWLNGQVASHHGPEDLLLANRRPQYQNRLIHLWVLAGRVGLPKLQNEAINMLKTRIRFDGNRIQTEDFGFVVETTKEGDPLRRFITDICISTLFGREDDEHFFVFDEDEYQFFPEALRQAIEKERFEKKDGARVGQMSDYHVAEEGERKIAVAKGTRGGT